MTSDDEQPTPPNTSDTRLHHYLVKHKRVMTPVSTSLYQTTNKLKDKENAAAPGSCGALKVFALNYFARQYVKFGGVITHILLNTMRYSKQSHSIQMTQDIYLKMTPVSIKF
jgi:hypothetical protein